MDGQVKIRETDDRSRPKQAKLIRLGLALMVWLFTMVTVNPQAAGGSVRDQGLFPTEVAADTMDALPQLNEESTDQESANLPSSTTSKIANATTEAETLPPVVQELLNHVPEKPGSPRWAEVIQLIGLPILGIAILLTLSILGFSHWRYTRHRQSLMAVSDSPNHNSTQSEVV